MISDFAVVAGEKDATSHFRKDGRENPPCEAEEGQGERP